MKMKMSKTQTVMMVKHISPKYMRVKQGFTLIELMITIAVIGILASIAYPSYVEYINRSNRAEGQAFLMDISAQQERFYFQQNRYASAVELGNPISERGMYTLNVVRQNNNQSYTLTANQQFNDTRCGNLTLTSTGVKGASIGTVDNCWR